MTLNTEPLQKWAKEIHGIACAHGWHEQKQPEGLYMCLVMTEVAEAVEADRNEKRANTEVMDDLMRIQAASGEGLSAQWYYMWYSEYYRMYIKGSVEEEFADILIRILDYCYERWGDNWFGYFANEPACETFAENAYVFVKDVLDIGNTDALSAIHYMYCWAEQLGIDLDKHILWKMKYNELRPYKHGGKKY